MNIIVKRVLAAISVLAVVVSSVAMVGMASGNNTAEAKSEWTIYSGKGKKFDVTDGLTVKVDNANVDLTGSSAKKDDLTLYVKFEIKNEDALNSFKTSGYIELAQDTYDKSELFWELSKQELSIGENELELNLSEAEPHCTEGSDYFTVKKPINWFRIYSTTDAKTGQELYTKTDVAVLKEVKLRDTRTAGLNFGNSRTYDTYLQLSEPIAEVPRTIEASVKKAPVITEWVLGKGVGTEASETSTIPDMENGPGEGITYYKVEAGEKVDVALNTRLNISTGQYALDALALSFWCYNGSSNVEKLAANGEQLRISSNLFNVAGNALYYVMQDITLNPGWNHIQLPLSVWPQWIMGNFSVGNIQSFGIDTGNYTNNGTTTRFFTDFELVVMNADEEENIEWLLGRSAGTPNAYTTQGPEEGTTYYKVSAGEKVNVPLNMKLGIDAGKYSMEELALGFWCYSESSNAEKLAANGEQLRISSNVDGVYSNALYYPMADITVEPGWNYIELPLSVWPQWIMGNFSVSNIQSFGIDVESYTNNSASTRYFTDLNLVVLSATNGEEGATTLLSKGIGRLKTYVTTESDTPGVGKICSIVEQGEKVEVPVNTKLGIDAGQYAMDDLAFSFWCYSGSTDTERLAANGEQLRISSNVDGVYSNALYYLMADITVKPGWNHIELPLSTWPQWIMGNFSVANIQSFGIDTESYTNNGTAVRYFTDFKLVVTASDSEPTEPEAKVEVTRDVDATVLASNYMIFSNTNIEDEKNPYALFITSLGYPALLWGDTQFTLTRDIATGEWEDIAVSKDADGYINFYVNGEFIAKSDEKAKDIGKSTTAHCIGADGTGGQIMEGTIADIRVWSDVRTEDEIKNSRVEKKPGVISNGLSTGTRGLLGSWFLVGDIQYVLETMPDASKYNNTALFLGSRADDWIDYELPSVLGENYWSVVFVPDIQNLTNAADYNETWKAMAQWIADNVKTENIKHVIAAGDSTWGNNDEQYGRAMEGFNKFKNLVSWSNMVGNHDYVWNITERDSTKYQEYFGESTIQNSAAFETYGGCFKDPAGKTTTENSYYRFSVNGVKWMILQLEYHPRLSVLNWAKELLETHATDNVILTTHAYLDGVGGYASNSYMNYINEDTDNAAGGYIGDTTAGVWEMLKGCTNVKLILCGHSENGTGAIVEKIENNADGESVPALMINAQDVDAGQGFRDGASYYTTQPLGMLGILRFSEDGKNVALQYYSPTADKSFSPEWNGKEDSNAHQYTFAISQCSHKNTTLLINENAATTKTSGYTGDIYCTDCQQFVKRGEMIPATGGDTTGAEESGDTDDKGVKGSTDPGTGDEWNPVQWSILLLAAAAMIVFAMRKLKSTEK